MVLKGEIVYWWIFILMGGNTIQTLLLQCLNQPGLLRKKHGKGTNTPGNYANWGGGNLWHRSSKKKLRAFGISSAFLLLSCSQNSMTTTFIPWSTVLLFPSVSSKSPSYLHCIFHRRVWNMEWIWISCLCLCWQAAQPNRNGSVEQNSWCWGPDIHTIRV